MVGRESTRRVWRGLGLIQLAILVGCGDVRVDLDPNDPGDAGPEIDADPGDPPVDGPIGGDTTPPEVESTTPGANAASVAEGVVITATFSEPMDLDSLQVAFHLTTSLFEAVEGVVTYEDRVLTFTPSAPLAAGTPYIAKITTDAKDLAGNPLAGRHEWNFTTLTARCVSPTVAGCARTIGAAVAASAPGDSIAVAAGTYPENLDIQKTVTLLGGFSADFDERDPFGLITTIQPADVSRTVITIRPDPDSGSPPPVAPIIDGFVVTGAVATIDGGGFCIMSSDAQLRNNTIHNNTAAVRGGGVFIQGGAPVLIGNVIENNAVTDGLGSGSGVFIERADATLQQNEIRGNKTGGLQILGGDPAPTIRLVENNIVDNEVKGDDLTPTAAGVAIANPAAVTIHGGRISGNRIENGRAGGIHVSVTTVAIVGVRIEKNAITNAIDSGSGVGADGATLRLMSSLVADNEAGNAGVWAENAARVAIVNSTIAGNPGMGIRTSSDMLLANSIITGETVGLATEFPPKSGAVITAVGNNFFSNEMDATGTVLDETRNRFVDPLFGETYHILDGSPLIGAGVVSGLKFPDGESVDLPEFDLDGQTRMKDGDPAIDIGADEWSN